MVVMFIITKLNIKQHVDGVRMKHAKSISIQFIYTILLLISLSLSTIATAAQVGKASWYGSYHHGKKTASGERFNMHALTAAHRTLPLGTIVEVRNKNNGKVVRVKINDRGPYHGNRIIDLSRGAANHIGLLKAGVGSVEVKVLSRPDRNKKYTASKVKLDTTKQVENELLALNSKPMINETRKDKLPVYIDPMDHLLRKINDSEYKPFAVSYQSSYSTVGRDPTTVALATELF